MSAKGAATRESALRCEASMDSSTSESQHEAQRGSREIDLPRRLSECDAEDLQIVERAEVAHVETDTGTGAEEQQNAAARAPRHIVLVDLCGVGTEVRL